MLCKCTEITRLALHNNYIGGNKERFIFCKGRFQKHSLRGWGVILSLIRSKFELEYYSFHKIGQNFANNWLELLHARRHRAGNTRKGRRLCYMEKNLIVFNMKFWTARDSPICFIKCSSGLKLRRIFSRIKRSNIITSIFPFWSTSYQHYILRWKFLLAELKGGGGGSPKRLHCDDRLHHYH